MMLLVLVVFVAYGIYVLKPEERKHVLRKVLQFLGNARDATGRHMSAAESFRAALRERTALPLVTGIIATVNLAVFFLMLIGAGSNADALIAMGANFAPRTTNGEWWRLLTMMFVQPGLLSLLVSLAALASAGVIVERLVGHATYAAVYLATGILASLVSVSSSQMAVSTGPSAAIFGIYGLLLTSYGWTLVHRSKLTMSLTTAKTLAPVAVLFVLYSLATDAIPSDAELTAFVAGLVCGAVLTRHLSEHTPPVREVAVVFAATVIAVVAIGVPLRGITDARPEIQRLIDVERQTAAAYARHVDEFTRGLIKPEVLADVIDRTIVPEIQSMRSRLKLLTKVPTEQQPLVSNGEEFLRLREESWRVRAQALQRHNMPLLQKADLKERASLQVLQQIAPDSQQ